MSQTGTWVSKWCWEQEGLVLEKSQAAAEEVTAMETEGVELQSEVLVVS